MKKSIVMCAGVCAALVLASCGSSKDSAFKKAYDKAKAQEQVATQPETPAPVVAPIVEKPATQSTVIDNVDNANVRTEDVTLVRFSLGSPLGWTGLPITIRSTCSRAM